MKTLNKILVIGLVLCIILSMGCVAPDGEWKIDGTIKHSDDVSTPLSPPFTESKIRPTDQTTSYSYDDCWGYYGHYICNNEEGSRDYLQLLLQYEDMSRDYKAVGIAHTTGNYVLIYGTRWSDWENDFSIYDPSCDNLLTLFDEMNEEQLKSLTNEVTKYEVVWRATGKQATQKTVPELIFDEREESVEGATGVQATQEVSSNLIIKSIEGVRAKNPSTDISDTIDMLKITVGLNVGSAPVDINQVVVSITDFENANCLVYANNDKSYATYGNTGKMQYFSPSASNNLQTLLTGDTIIGNSPTRNNSDSYFVAEKIRDDDSSFSQDNPIMNTGDLITIYVSTMSGDALEYTTVGITTTGATQKDSNLDVTTRTTVSIILTPESGAATTSDFVTPSSYGVQETVLLYP